MVLWYFFSCFCFLWSTEFMRTCFHFQWNGFRPLFKESLENMKGGQPVKLGSEKQEAGRGFTFILQMKTQSLKSFKGILGFFQLIKTGIFFSIFLLGKAHSGSKWWGDFGAEAVCNSPGSFGLHEKTSPF